MKELRDVLEAIRAAHGRGEGMALATIVGVQGSTYRREGARLLIMGSGEMIGNISGGCLEGDVHVVAQDVMADRRPRLAVYDLTADDDIVWGLGLGCNGKVDVFVEPVDEAAMRLALLRAALDDETGLAAAVVVQGTDTVPAGTRVVLRSDGRGEGILPDASADERLRRAMSAALAEGRSGRRSIATPEGALDLFIEVLRPPIRLVVIGAGHDAIPVVLQGVALGWRVLVVDGRETFLTPERFPGARFLKVSFKEAAEAVPLDDRTSVLVMTHNYLHDRTVLRGFLTRRDACPAYLGMLGPRLRTEKMLSELGTEGIGVPEELRGRLYSPVGLDLGSEGPEEIALAAVAEIVAVDRGRAAGFLRDRRAPIHAPVP